MLITCQICRLHWLLYVHCLPRTALRGFGRTDSWKLLTKLRPCLIRLIFLSIMTLEKNLYYLVTLHIGVEAVLYHIMDGSYSDIQTKDVPPISVRTEIRDSYRPQVAFWVWLRQITLSQPWHHQEFKDGLCFWQPVSMTLFTDKVTTMATLMEAAGYLSLMPYVKGPNSWGDSTLNGPFGNHAHGCRSYFRLNSLRFSVTTSPN